MALPAGSFPIKPPPPGSPLVEDFWVDYADGFGPVTKWDQLFLGGLVWPGLCQVESSSSLGVEVNKFIQNPGAKIIDQTYRVRLIDKGYEPCQVKATIAVWHPDDWTLLKKILPLFTPRTTQKNRPALEIRHPSTALMGIKFVIINDIIIHHPVEQTLYVDLSLVQWFEYLNNKPFRSSGGAQASGPPAKPTAGNNVATK